MFLLDFFSACDGVECLMLFLDFFDIGDRIEVVLDSDDGDGACWVRMYFGFLLRPLIWDFDV